MKEIEPSGHPVVKTSILIFPRVLRIKNQLLKKILETLKDSLNLKENLKEIELGGHQVVKTHILIFPRVF